MLRDEVRGERWPGRPGHAAKAAGGIVCQPPPVFALLLEREPEGSLDIGPRRERERLVQSIAETRVAAKEHVVRAAAEAAIAIVARLTGETVTAGDASRAVEEA